MSQRLRQRQRPKTNKCLPYSKGDFQRGLQRPLRTILMRLRLIIVLVGLLYLFMGVLLALHVWWLIGELVKRSLQ